MTPCAQPDCTGHIEDGYCNVCGLAAPKARPASTPVFSGIRSSRRSSRSSSPSGRRVLGAGLISVPELPSIEPEQSILTDARVPDNKRYCARCDRALGREKGFCGQCGQKYSFVPTLRPGDLLAGQYEVKGAIAYGGLGWIYLAFDRILSRYVVLKGLLNTEDAGAAAVAVAERQFLAAVKHPNIVGIYNFLQHGPEGFIVMEYVGGKTLRDIRRTRGPLPPAEAIAYIHRLLDAFSYLHQRNLVYCDFKPENVMLEAGDVKLIDLGGVRRIDDPMGDIYGTEGYNAPEAGEGPTVASDLYTIGRTLAVLLADIRGFTKELRHALPGPEEEPLFAIQESLFRFLLKATAENPEHRFASADEMADQLLGVLREIVAVETAIPRPAPSSYFGPDMLALLPSNGCGPVLPDFRQLPLPVLDVTDPGAILVMNAGATSLRQIAQQAPRSVEARLRLVSSLIDARQYDDAAQVLKQVESDDPWEWRTHWYRARLLLAQGKAEEARTIFDQICFDLPGELAPRLALAMSAEQARDFASAIRLYDLVSRTDPGFTSACFGLARCLMARGDRAAAIAALGRIPQTSSLYTRAQVEAARVLVVRNGTVPGLAELTGAAGALEGLPLEGMERHRLAQQVLETALYLVTSRAVKPDASVSILGRPLQEKPLRRGLEKSLRALARLSDGEEKIRLVDEANRVRPRTLF